MANMHLLVRFRPTDEELFAHYLVGKATGVPDVLIQERDIYSEEPWNIFDTTSDQTFYVFAMLRKNKSRVLRTAGTGTWKEQHSVEIRDAHGKLVGYKKSFKFKEGCGSSATSGRWIMYEYSMCDETQCKWVLCKIKYHKDQKKSEEKAIVIPDHKRVQFEDDNQPAKRMCVLDDYGCQGHRANFIYDSVAPLPSSTVDQAQPAASHAVVSSDFTCPAFDQGAYNVNLFPTMTDQVDDDDGWMDYLIDPVVHFDDDLFSSELFASPSEEETTVDQAQPTASQAVSSGATDPAFDHEAHIDLFPTTTEQVNNDDGWINRLMEDMDQDPVICWIPF